LAGSRLPERIRSADPSAVAALLAGLAAVAVIRTTMLPTIGTWDTAEAQVVPPVLGTMHPTGFPAFAVLGWLASIVLQPFGSPAFLMNLLSALLVGAAVGCCVLVSRRLGAPLPVALAIAAAFALTPIVWQIGNAADAHALHLALLAAVVLGLLRWEALIRRRGDRPDDAGARRAADRAIVLTAAVFGVAVANHALALLLAPAIGLFVLAVDPRVVRRPRLIVGALGACIGVAVLLYLELPLRAGVLRAPLVYGHPETWNGFWEIVLGRQFQGDFGDPARDLGSRVGSLLELATAQFGPLVAILPAGILVTVVRHPRYALLSIVATGLTCAFAIAYENARIERYYLGPVLFAWTWLAVFAAVIVERVTAGWRAHADEAERADDDPDGSGRRHADLPVDGPPGVPAWRTPAGVLAMALSVALLVPTATDLADRWREADRSRETWVDDWLDETFAALEPDAVVISWWSYSTPLWYGQLVDGRRTDVWVVDDRTRLDLDLGEVANVIEANLDTRPVYLIRATTSEVDVLTDRYAIEPVDRPGNLFRVTGRQETTP
jgi:hypothetical protein